MGLAFQFFFLGVTALGEAADFQCLVWEYQVFWDSFGSCCLLCPEEDLAYDAVVDEIDAVVDEVAAVVFGADFLSAAVVFFTFVAVLVFSLLFW